ncbi:MAG: hypothetical protein NTU53_15970 [Planctomycetota bacterium]|nr:hypothetical protein [Planctomycetota bacterium]
MKRRLGGAVGGGPGGGGQLMRSDPFSFLGGRIENRLHFEGFRPVNGYDQFGVQAPNAFQFGLSQAAIMLQGWLKSDGHSPMAACRLKERSDSVLDYLLDIQGNCSNMILEGTRWQQRGRDVVDGVVLSACQRWVLFMSGRDGLAVA